MDEKRRLEDLHLSVANEYGDEIRVNPLSVARRFSQVYDFDGDDYWNKNFENVPSPESALEMLGESDERTVGFLRLCLRFVYHCLEGKRFLPSNPRHFPPFDQFLEILD